jgi:hypothetical protein
MQPGELYPWMAQHGLSVLQVGAYTNHALVAHLYERGTLNELTQWWPEEQQFSPQQFLQVFRTHGYYGDKFAYPLLQPILETRLDRTPSHDLASLMLRLQVDAAGQSLWREGVRPDLAPPESSTDTLQPPSNDIRINKQHQLALCIAFFGLGLSGEYKESLDVVAYRTEVRQWLEQRVPRSTLIRQALYAGASSKSLIQHYLTDQDALPDQGQMPVVWELLLTEASRSHGSSGRVDTEHLQLLKALWKLHPEVRNAHGHNLPEALFALGQPELARFLDANQAPPPPLETPEQRREAFLQLAGQIYERLEQERLKREGPSLQRGGWHGHAPFGSVMHPLLMADASIQAGHSIAEALDRVDQVFFSGPLRRPRFHDLWPTPQPVVTAEVAEASEARLTRRPAP